MRDTCCGRGPMATTPGVLYLWIDQFGQVRDVGRICREPFDQEFPRVESLVLKRRKMRPWTLRVDVVGRNRRNTTPIINAGRDQLWQHVGAQIRRGLDVHLSAEQDSRDSNRPEMVLKQRLRVIRHPGSRLSAEILDD